MEVTYTVTRDTNNNNLKLFIAYKPFYGEGLHAEKISDLFQKFFSCYSNYVENKPNSLMSYDDILFEETMKTLNLTAEDMMLGIDSLYDELLKMNPELFI